MAFEGQDGGVGAFVPFTWHNLAFGRLHSVTISAAKYGLVEMGHFHAVPEVVAVAADRLVAIVRVGTDGSVVVRDRCQRRVVYNLRFGAPGTAGTLGRDSRPVLSVVQATEAQWERARRREAVITDLVNGDDLSDQVTRASIRLGVSRRTVFRWLAAYRDTPQTSSLLVRPGGTPPGARRIDARLEELIAEVIRDVYLTKVRAKKEEVVRQVGLRCSSERLAPPSRKAILARVRALDVRGSKSSFASTRSGFPCRLCA